MFKPIQDQYSQYLDVYPVVKNSVSHIIHKAQALITEHLITEQIPRMSATHTILINSLLISQMLQQPQESFQISEDCEPLQARKESFAQQTKLLEVVENKRLQQSSHSNGSRMMKSVIGKQSKPPSMPAQNQSMNAQKIEHGLFTQDESDEYYRNLHERKQQVIEQMMKNRQKLLSEQQSMQNQMEEIKKKYQRTTVTYDVDGSILVLNQQKPKFEINVQQLQAKVNNKGQTKSISNYNPKSIERSNIENPQLQQQQKIEQQKFEDVKPIIGHIQQTTSYNTEAFNKSSNLNKLKKLMHDTNIRLTKEQYKEVVAYTNEISGQIIKMHYAPKKPSMIYNQSRDSTPLLKQISEQKIVEQQSLLKTLSSQANRKFGQIRVLRQNKVSELMITQQVQDQEALPMVRPQEKAVTEMDEDVRVISFVANGGQLPVLKKTYKPILQPSKARSITTYY